MGRITLGFLFLFLAANLLAQSTISEARKKAVGSTVTVSGIVTNGDELGLIKYIQDESAGIAIYDGKLANSKRGDSITVTGVLDDFNNLLEITTLTGFTTHSSGNIVPDPIDLSISEIGEQYEGMLIKIEGVEIIGSTGTFSGSQNYSFSDGVHTGELRISSSSPIVGQPIPSGSFNLIAICSQYSFSSNDTQTGYQLLPRTMDDLISGNAVNFLTSVDVIYLTKSSVTLGWETDNGATPFVRYGSSNRVDSLKNIKQGDSTTSDEHNSHIAEITGLNPAEIVFAQVFMVLESDTVYSPVGIYITESNSTGAMHVYFNSAVDQTLADEMPAVNLGQNMEDTLAACINRAGQSIDLAIYNFDNQMVGDALNAAYDRGVKIRIITCGSTTHASISDLNTGISVLERPEEINGGIMHNKFAIFDVNSVDPDKTWVWSGSTNLTSSQLFYDANNMVFIQDQSLAKSYQIEFEEMWGSTGETTNALKAKFGEDKSDNTPHKFMIGGNLVESYFSPSDNTNQRLIDAIGTADNDLYVETMLITRSDLSGAILDAYDRGANVHVITNAEPDNTTYVNDALLNGLPAGKFVFDTQQSGILHHKLAIIDAYKKDSDPQVITGSHNWSNAANAVNDENTLIIHNPDIANQYIQQFAYRFEHNDGTLIVSAQIVQTPELKVFPNPSAGRIQVQSAKPLKSIQLFSLNGEKVGEWILSSEYEMNLELPVQVSGMFILKVEDVYGVSNVYKIIKQ